MNKLIIISVAAVIFLGCKDKLPQEPEPGQIGGGTGEIVYTTMGTSGADKVVVSKVDGSGSTVIANGLLVGPPAAGRIAYTRNDSLFVASRSGGTWQERLIVGARDSSERLETMSIALSPDGRLVTYTMEQLVRVSGGWQEGATYAFLAQADGGAGSGTMLPKYPAHETAPKFSPDSRWLAVYTGELAWANGDGELWVMGIGGSGDVHRVADGIKPGFDGVGWLDWSPDAQRIAYHSHGANKDLGTLYVVNRDGSGKRQLEAGAYPVWAPDGKTITYIGGVTADIFTRNADGTGTPRNISNEPGLFNIYPQISPDGKQVVYTVYAGDVEKYPGALKVAEIGNPSHVRTVVQASADVNAYKAFWLP